MARTPELGAFGAALRELRLEAGLSQEVLGHTSGLHRNYIGGLERGERNIALINLFRLAAALEIRPSQLVGRRRLCEHFEREPLIAEAWALKESFRAIYQARSRVDAAQRLERFLTACRLAAIPSFDAFAEGVRLWREELLAYFDEPVTNGYAEGVINKIKVIKRRAYGLPTFQGFRRRVLVACA